MRDRNSSHPERPASDRARDVNGETAELTRYVWAIVLAWTVIVVALSAAKTATILIVEDDAHVRRLTQRTVERLGHQALQVLLDAGASAFIQKPFEMDVFEAEIRKALLG